MVTRIYGTLIEAEGSEEAVQVARDLPLSEFDLDDTQLELIG